MPSLARRRELDVRSGRFESEIRDAEVAQGALVRQKRLAYCARCQKAFEESSKVCPRCDKKDEMGFIAPIPEQYVEQANRREMERLRAKYR